MITDSLKQLQTLELDEGRGTTEIARTSYQLAALSNRLGPQAVAALQNSKLTADSQCHEDFLPNRGKIGILDYWD